MNNKKMQLIDFSQGIKSTEVQHNFDALQYQLNKERASVGGAGISYGFDFDLKDFSLKIGEGCLIDNEGSEVYIDEKTIDIEKPILIEKIETLNVDQYNRVYLSETPYAKTRLTIAENVNSEDYGISVVKANTEDKISVASIDGQVLNLKATIGTLTDVTVVVSYYYTYKRRDVIFIDNEYKIQYKQGITSTSPSIPSLDKNEYKYILGYLEVNGMHKNIIDNEINAKASIIKEFKSVRNVYTDNNNKLYLCGTPFESLKVIHLVEPSDPEENCFWYDAATNKLKIWRATDNYTFIKKYTVETSNPNAENIFETDVPYLYKGEQLKVYVNNKLLNTSKVEEGVDLSAVDKREEYVFSSAFKVLSELHRGDIVSYRITRTDGFMSWVTINDSSYTEMEERHLWTPEMMENEEVDFNHDKQLFLFNAVTNRNLLYTPDKNCLKILINQMPLHNDQFTEITLKDALVGDDAEYIMDKLVKYYGYPEAFDMDSIHEDYENIGIGFKLDAPLDKNSYIEVRVSQRVNANPIAKRFQRTATFVDEGHIEYSDLNESVFQTTGKFRYEENQLEVFLNGVRLNKGIDFEEICESNTPLKGQNCNKFRILRNANIKNGDVVSYKITTTIYSYDHVEALLSDFNKDIEDCKQIVAETKEAIDRTNEEVTEKIKIVEGQIENVQQITNNLDDTYINKNEVITASMIDVNITQNIMKESFYHTIVVTTEREYDITNICSPKDFTLLFNTNDNNGNKILKRGTGNNDEYNIMTSGDETKLVLLSSSINEGHILFLTGIKFGI